MPQLRLLAKGLFAHDYSSACVPGYGCCDHGCCLPQTLELKRILRDPASNLLFVVSPKWQRSPLVTRSIEKDGRTAHCIAQKEGGPTIDVLWHRSREVSGILAVPPGSISYHDCFWNPITGRTEPVAEELIKTYREMRSHLVRGGRKIRRTHRQLIATKNTLVSGLRLIDLKNNVGEETRFVPIDEGLPTSGRLTES